VPEESSRPTLGLPWIAAFALAKWVFHLTTVAGYGYFRDELYYLACSEHLGWGYVDHPPLSVFVLWVVRSLLGDSLLAIRLLPAFLGATTVALVGLMVRALGGGRWAGVLAMTAALVAPVYLALDHFYSMNAFDLLFWALAGYLLLRIASGGPPWLWLLLGGVLGLGLLNKISVLWLGAGLLVGLVATRQRRWLATRWPWLAGGLAALIFAPHLLWQMLHGWPTLEFIRNATGEKMVQVGPLDFFFGQVDMMLLATLPLWLAGLAYLLFHPRARDYRLLGWIYLTVFAILAASGSSRSGYLAAAYSWLFAAGGVAVAGLLERRRWAWVVPVLVVLMLAMGALVAPLAVPILPVERYLLHASWLGQEPATEERKELGELGQFFADMHGWPAIVDTVAEVYHGLSPAERAKVRVLAPDYGIAGALDLLGKRRGLPPTLSGHNSYWLWGPGDWDGEVMIVVGGSEERLRASFQRVDRAATLDCGRCMPYENGRPVWVGRGLLRPVAEVWPQLKHYD